MESGPDAKIKIRGAGFDHRLRVEAEARSERDVQISSKKLKSGHVFDTCSYFNDIFKLPLQHVFLSEKNNVVSVVIAEKNIKGEFASGEEFTTYAPDDSKLVEILREYNVLIKAKPEDTLLKQILVSALPFLIFILFIR